MFRCPTRGRVLAGELSPAREEPAERAVEVRPPRRRAALDDTEAVGREDERLESRAQLVGRAERTAVHADPPGVARREDDVDLDRDLGARSCQLHPPRRLTEADELRVVARTGREPLGADMKRLEKVRLPGPVRAGHEDDPRLERELELRIGAEVSKRGVSDDQPSVGRRRSAGTQSGSRIGMIRYQKLSSGEDSNPGRNGLISWSSTVSPLTASRPSRRKSGLNPISSGSPA